MGVKEEKPITMVEVVALAGDSEKSLSIKAFIKNFTKMDVKVALEIKSKLAALDLVKLKEFYIVKIVDFMPRTATELNKILIDVSLDTEEVNKILDVLSEY